MDTKGIEKFGKTKRPVMIWVLVALVLVGIVIGATMCRGKSASAAAAPATITQSVG